MKKMLKNTLILTMLLMSTISYSQSNPEVIDTTVNVPNNLTNVLDNYLTSFSTVDYHDEDYFIDNYKTKKYYTIKFYDGSVVKKLKTNSMEDLLTIVRKKINVLGSPEYLVVMDVNKNLLICNERQYILIKKNSKRCVTLTCGDDVDSFIP